MAKNINSLQLLRNETLFSAKTEAISAIESAATNDGTVKLARYYDGDKGGTSANVKTIFGICYKPVESESGFSYTIYDSPKEVIEALGDRVSDNEKAIALLNSGATVSGSVAYSIEKAIEKLDVDAIGGSGKVITTVSEADGKIAATAIDLVASAVTAPAVTADDNHVAVASGTVESQIASLAASIKTTVKDAKSYKITAATEEELATLGANVQEAYKLVDEDGTKSGDYIKIYKDSSLQKAELVGQELQFTYLLADGTKKVVKIDVSTFLAESEFKDGLEVVDHVVNVKVDAQSESFLTVGAGGVKLSGVQDAIDSAVGTAINDLDATVSAETTHVSVTVTQVDGKLTGVTVAEDDIASANALTAETSARAAEDAKIVAGVGFATGGTYTIAANTGAGESLSAASGYTVANALYTLDDAIAAAKKANKLTAGDTTVVVENPTSGGTTVKVNIVSADTVSNFVGYAEDGSFVKSEMFAGIDAGTYK